MNSRVGKVIIIRFLILSQFKEEDVVGSLKICYKYNEGE